VTVAVSVPLVVGVNEIVFVQLAPAGSGFGQVDAVFANELAFAPVTVVVAVKLTAAVPVFFTVISCVAVVPTGVEANVTGTGLNVRVGLAPPVAVPLRAMLCGELPASSTACKVAVRLPETSGLNVRFTTQELPAATLLPQVLV
jgi:hypothetical protein